VATEHKPSRAREQAGHRERLIEAMADSIREKGYRETTVADVVRIARTSRRTFYEHFEDREACFLALFDSMNDATIARIEQATRPDRPWPEQVDQAVGAYVDQIAARPRLWRSFIRELPALGEAGGARQVLVMQRFADMLVNLVDAGLRVQPKPGAEPLSAEMGIIISGGLTLLMVFGLDHGRDLGELKPIAADAVKAILSGTVVH
jgi:AcrR family transcriptional regulator